MRRLLVLILGLGLFGCSGSPAPMSTASPTPAASSSASATASQQISMLCDHAVLVSALSGPELNWVSWEKPDVLNDGRPRLLGRIKSGIASSSGIVEIIGDPGVEQATWQSYGSSLDILDAMLETTVGHDAVAFVHALIATKAPSESRVFGKAKVMVTPSAPGGPMVIVQLVKATGP
jgi:hypothetical protein